ncbi:hypothetical protein BABINDRAFT_171892 [Babjeviella inositovora NRRL Y-12698]|uniref:ribose-phosphate diphosphokinase n=1 Tax=Babjeviella inositovora NRRL Y-12698 TaxID=984486 RepID=A0A1E3QN97_9ASCO|nr:uncharacterized protein BABINDRAFT_171892 [Babjeviella inositovora NRRL Y-12698]ODQ79110.1 hypothetical protein BABINDRAFT_171892 [Babjeviella inositovora NRRL Y-12698]
MRDLVVLSGSSHPKLTERICRNLSIEQGEVDLAKFSNGETSATIKKSVREKDVFIVQSGCGHVNDNFIELLIMISACKTSSARRVTAVLPLFPYSRQPDIPYTRTGAPHLPSMGPNQISFDTAPTTPGSTSRESSRPPSDPKTDAAAPIHRAIGQLRKEDMPSAPPSPTRSRSSTRIPVIPMYQPTSLATNLSSLLGSFTPLNAAGKQGYKQWIAQSGTLIANLLTTAGADHIITMDLHDPQFQGFFDIPVDNLYTRPLMAQYIKEYIPDYLDAVVVSPDAGGAKRAITVADKLGCSFALIHKERRQKMTASSDPNHTSGPSSDASVVSSPHPNVVLTAKQTMVATTMMVGDVKGKVCVLIDDLVDTSSTIVRAAKLLKDQGAKYVYALVTHGVFSGDAIDRINSSCIDKLVVTNSAPQEENVELLGGKVEVLDVSRVLGEAIRRIHNGESVSMLFDQGW